MPEAWLELDTALKKRIHMVLEDPQRLATEAELRKLSEEVARGRIHPGCRAQAPRASARRTQTQIRLALWERSWLHFRRVHDFRAHVVELDRLLPALDDRARRVRT
jgi:hypothetical protein